MPQTQKPTQAALFYSAGRRLAETDATALELLFGRNPITDLELAAAIEKRPALWARYRGFIGQRPGAGGIYWGA